MFPLNRELVPDDPVLSTEKTWLADKFTIFHEVLPLRLREILMRENVAPVSPANKILAR
jgi:hypothetical protein